MLSERRLYLAVQGAGRSGRPVLVEALVRTSAERTQVQKYRVTRLLALGYDEGTSMVRKGDYRGVAAPARPRDGDATQIRLQDRIPTHSNMYVGFGSEPDTIPEPPTHGGLKTVVCAEVHALLRLKRQSCCLVIGVWWSSRPSCCASDLWRLLSAPRPPPIHQERYKPR